MSKIEKFEDLDIWKSAKKLCQKIFDITNREPFSKDYRFKDQIRSSSGSIMDNPVKYRCITFTCLEVRRTIIFT